MPVGAPAAAEDGELGEPAADRWERRGLYIVRIHNIPRRKLLAPDQCLLDPPPCGIECLDVICKSDTNGEEHTEGVRQETEMCWIGSKEFDEKPILNEWVGETRFDLVLPHPKRGYYMFSGTLMEN